VFGFYVIKLTLINQMFFQELLENQLVYQVIFGVLLIVFLNKVLSARLKDHSIPLIPRVLRVRNQADIPNSSPALFESLKVFLADLQQKRQNILAGNFQLY
jgi:hypothetical protein